MNIDEKTKPTRLSSCCPNCSTEISIVLSPKWEIGEKLAYTHHILAQKSFFGEQKEGLLTDLYGPQYYTLLLEKS